VLTRDGSKTLANDTPDLPDMRRLSTRALRAERDRLLGVPVAPLICVHGAHVQGGGLHA
jgi:hypothetical protein